MRQAMDDHNAAAQDKRSGSSGSGNGGASERQQRQRHPELPPLTSSSAAAAVTQESDALLAAASKETTSNIRANNRATRNQAQNYGATATTAAAAAMVTPSPPPAPPSASAANNNTSNFQRSNQHQQQQQRDQERRGDHNEDDDDDDEDDDDDDDEGEYLLEDDDDDDDDDDNDELDYRPEPILHKCWRLVKDCFLLVINVDNLYDEDGMIMTPPSSSSPSASANTNTSSTLPTTITSPSADATSQGRRNHLVVFFWFCILAISYGLERSSFKLLVDRAGPFRLFSVLMVTAVHALVIGFGMALSTVHRRRQQQLRRRQQQEATADFAFSATAMGPLGIPLVDVGVMALLDTVQILLVFISALHVPPTFSVILVQFTLPFAALLTQFVRPNGRCGNLLFRRNRQQEQGDETEWSSRHSSSTATATPSPTTHYQQVSPNNNNNSSNNNNGSNNNNHNNGNNNLHMISQHLTAATTTARTTTGSSSQRPGTPLEGWGGLSAEHLWGSIIISVAVILALCPALYSILNPDFFVYADPIPLQTAYNTLLYVSSCIPAAASQLYKESVFSHHKQPVDSNYLNVLLSIFQFIIASITAPLIYGLQGLGAKKHWQHLYPPSTFSENFWDGTKCFFGLLDEQKALNGYEDDAHCTFSFGLVLLHVLSIISVGVAVDKILQAGATKVMYRGISVGIFVAVLSMYTYDLRIPDYNYGPAMDSLTLACLLLLIVGAEVYHRVSLQDAAFETVYAEVENLYATEE